MNKPKVLVFDIETAPCKGYFWGLFDQNIGLNQITEDWTILAWAAKWLNSSKVIYMDNRKAKNVRDDKKIVQGIAVLLNEADIIITQNGQRFDVKKVNARAVINGLPPIKPFKPSQHIDIYKEEKTIFGYTSHKLEYKTDKINKKYKKLKHSNYPGFELWAAVLTGDTRAWKEMEKYTKYDVLSTEEHYELIKGWIKTPPMSAFIDDEVMRCKCGGSKLTKRGFAITDAGKYQIYQCLTVQKNGKICGKWPRSPINLLTASKKRSMLREIKGR